MLTTIPPSPARRVRWRTGLLVLPLVLGWAAGAVAADLPDCRDTRNPHRVLLPEPERTVVVPRGRSLQAAFLCHWTGNVPVPPPTAVVPRRVQPPSHPLTNLAGQAPP